jgi:hypothetical protein
MSSDAEMPHRAGVNPHAQSAGTGRKTGISGGKSLVEGPKGFRASVGPNEHRSVNSFNELVSVGFAGH